MIEEFYNDDNRKDYFAIRGLYNVWTDQKGSHEKLIDGVASTFIRLAKKDEEDSQLDLETYDTERDDVIEKFMFLPPMQPKNRHCLYCQGQSGKGKSYLLDDYVGLFKIINPRNDVLYFTLNNAEIDVSLTKKNYKIIPMQAFLLSLGDINANLDAIKSLGYQFANKLLVFDDVGNLKNDRKVMKIFWNFIDQAIENFRKHNVSIYIIAHSSRTGTHGTVMKEEMTHYVITGNALQTQNDRILSAYFGFTDKEASTLLEGNDRWVCIDTGKKVAIFPKKIHLCTKAHLQRRYIESTNAKNNEDL